MKYFPPKSPPSSAELYPPSWGEAALAGLPHLLVGLVFALPSALTAVGLKPPVTRLASSGAFIGILELILAGILIVALAWTLFYSWRAGRSGRIARPWMGSWYGYGLLVLSAALLVPLYDLRTPLLGGHLVEAVTIVALPLVLAGLLFCLAWQDPLKELLAALPVAAVLWLPVLEFVPNPVRASVTFCAWLLLTLATVLIIRFSDGQ